MQTKKEKKLQRGKFTLPFNCVINHRLPNGYGSHLEMVICGSDFFAQMCKDNVFELVRVRLCGLSVIVSKPRYGEYLIVKWSQIAEL